MFALIELVYEQGPSHVLFACYFFLNVDDFADRGVVLDDEVQGVVLVLHTGQRYRIDIHDLLRRLLVISLGFHKLLSEMIGVHALFKDELDHILCILGGILFEIWYNIIENVAIRGQNTSIVDDLVNQLKVLDFYGQIYSVPKLFALDLDVQVVRVVADQELSYIRVFVFQCYNYGCALFIIDSVNVDDATRVRMIQVQNVFNHGQLIVFGQLVQYRPVFGRIQQTLKYLRNRLFLMLPHEVDEELRKVETVLLTSFSQKELEHLFELFNCFLGGVGLSSGDATEERLISLRGNGVVHLRDRA